MTPAWLVRLEESLAADEGTEALATGLVVLATVAGRDVHLDEDEAYGAARRALLLLSAGGDPDRGLDLNGRAVGALAADLRTVDRQIALEEGLRQLRVQAEELPHVGEAVRGLVDAPDVAWRAYAAGVLAQALAED
ncbi:MAG TPA: hypothetical protein VD769_02345 [Gaiellaceae bacterium]|nr:hypothetical protein [Gaiellaceae bacterium]